MKTRTKKLGIIGLSCVLVAGLALAQVVGPYELSRRLAVALEAVATAMAFSPSYTGTGVYDLQLRQTLAAEYIATSMTNPVNASVTLTNGELVVGAGGTALRTTNTLPGLTLTAPLLAADGSAAAPGMSFASDTDTGIALPTAGRMQLSVANAYRVMIDTQNIAIGSAMGYSWDNGSTADGSGEDLWLVRDAAATLAQRDAANAQTFRVYGTYTGASDYERASLSHDGSGDLTLAAETAGTGADDQTVRVITTGTGAFIVDDSTATAGNARGTDAIEINTSRSLATQVSSGANSIALGTLNTSSGSSSIAIGNSLTASQTASIAMGLSLTASGSYSMATGWDAAAVRLGQEARSAGRFALDGDAQASRFIARNTTTNNTPVQLWLDGTDDECAIPANTTWMFEIQVVARSTDAGTGDEESAAYKIVGAIERHNAANTTVILGTPTYTVVAEDDAAWNVAVSADTTNGALDITCTGNNETTVRWVATITCTEVGG